MEIELQRIGMVENLLVPVQRMDYSGPPWLDDFINFVETTFGSGIKREINGDTIILINERSVKSFDKVRQIPLSDGDVVVLSTIMHGGCGFGSV